MEIKKTATVEKVVQVVCDACGHDCDKWGEDGTDISTSASKTSTSYGEVVAHEGWNIDLCWGCADRVRLFIRDELGASVQFKAW